MFLLHEVALIMVFMQVCSYNILFNQNISLN